jgi:8-oxo-dGTP pyrophosphatase MutT (NUDIX family)
MARNYSIFVNQSVLNISAASAAQPDVWPSSAAAAEQLFERYLQLFAHPESQESHTVTTQNPEQTFAAFQKHFMVIEAAGGLVFNTNKQMLWIHRLGKWDLPKGKVEPGEGIAACAKREISEECGLPEAQLHIVQPLPNTYHTYNLKGQHILKTTFWFEMLFTGTAELIPQTEEDIEAVQWFDLQAIQEGALMNTYQNISSFLRQVQFI